MKPLRNPDVQSKLLPDGHVVLFADQNNWAHTITPLAGIAWEFCDGRHSLEQIVENVKEIAGLDSSNSIKVEMSKLIEELYESGLLIYDAADQVPDQTAKV